MKTDLDALEKLEQAMTMAPWHQEPDDDAWSHLWGRAGSMLVATGVPDDMVCVAFIRNALPSLIAELRAAREVVRVASILVQAVTEDYGKFGAASVVEEKLRLYDQATGER